MAEEAQTTEQAAEAKTEEKGKGSMMKKLLIFGVPAFFVQLVLVYFLTAKFVVPFAVQHQGGNAGAETKGENHSTDSANTGAVPEAAVAEQNIYIVKDLIINPAGTNGQRYLLTTIAFNLSSEEAVKSMESKEMAVRDMLNSILTSKSMEDLIDVSKRESLRQEVAVRGQSMLSKGKLLSVYFSKYIVQ